MNSHERAHGCGLSGVATRDGFARRPVRLSFTPTRQAERPCELGVTGDRECEVLLDIGGGVLGPSMGQMALC